jgi:hypothetical protein
MRPTPFLRWLFVLPLILLLGIAGVPSNPMVVSTFGGNQVNTWVFSIALPIPGHTDRADPRDLRLRGQDPPRLNCQDEGFRYAPEQRISLSSAKVGTKPRSDDLLAVEERPEQLANWAASIST